MLGALRRWLRPVFIRSSLDEKQQPVRILLNTRVSTRALFRPAAHPQPPATRLLLAVQGEANQSLLLSWQACRAARAGCKWLAGKQSCRDNLPPTTHAEEDQVSCH